MAFIKIEKKWKARIINVHLLEGFKLNEKQTDNGICQAKTDMDFGIKSETIFFFF